MGTAALVPKGKPPEVATGTRGKESHILCSLSFPAFQELLETREQGKKQGRKQGQAGTGIGKNETISDYSPCLKCSGVGWAGSQALLT